MDDYTRFTNLECHDLLVQNEATFDSLQANFVGFKIAPNIEIWEKLGEISFSETSGIAVNLGSLSPDMILTGVVCEIEEAFNSGTSDVLILGTADDDDVLMVAGDIETTVDGRYYKAASLVGGADGIDIKAKLTKTGAAATTGKAVFYVRILLPFSPEFFME